MSAETPSARELLRAIAASTEREGEVAAAELEQSSSADPGRDAGAQWEDGLAQWRKKFDERTEQAERALSAIEKCLADRVAAESREPEELREAIAALTGTQLEEGDLSAGAWSQVRCSEVGQAKLGALPWRPAVGGACYYYFMRSWLLVRRIADLGDPKEAFPQRFETINVTIGGAYLYCDAAYDGIRPLGSLPIPASIRLEAEG